MSKLKQYEIDALVSIIRRQVTEETKAKNKAKFSKAQEEMQTIVVRNEIIVNQIDASADMQEFVKKLVKKYSE